MRGLSGLHTGFPRIPSVVPVEGAAGVVSNSGSTASDRWERGQGWRGGVVNPIDNIVYEPAAGPCSLVSRPA